MMFEIGTSSYDFPKFVKCIQTRIGHLIVLLVLTINAVIHVEILGGEKEQGADETRRKTTK